MCKYPSWKEVSTAASQQQSPGLESMGPKLFLCGVWLLYRYPGFFPQSKDTNAFGASGELVTLNWPLGATVSVNDCLSYLLSLPHKTHIGFQLGFDVLSFFCSPPKNKSWSCIGGADVGEDKYITSSKKKSSKIYYISCGTENPQDGTCLFLFFYVQLWDEMAHLNFSWANLAALNRADILPGKIPLGKNSNV